ncbi:hypothetical protein AAFF_G00277400 [Aldrovandia affinis]|uniref:Kelch-like protein 33 n=1 Tax=Aldrovandia affinis TaxID=143900 RepID=A0AAD7RAT3_9TELE|nr:hypothetical protein AAFF_G00277400 [Aldrovandia affinis]
MGARERGEEDEEAEEEEQEFCRHTHPRELFSSLEELRASALLTDLSLSTVEWAGLAAVVEFSYTGAIAGLSRATVAWVRGAASELGAPRVLQLCGLLEGEEREESRVSAQEQLELTLASVRQLWAERSACDVQLQVEDATFTDWDIFKTNNNNLDDYADAVTSYISFCEETCIPTRAVYKFNNCKPWFPAELGKLRTNKEEAYRSGDRDAYKRAKYALNKAVKTAKRRYKDKLEQPHRAILAGCSEYFRGMFCSGMLESRQERVELRALGAAEFGALLRSCYTGALALGWGCVFETACTAMQLQLRLGLPLCLRFLHQRMGARSCLDVAAFAEAYGIRALRQEAHDFALSRFPEVAATPKFLDLAEERLLALLQDEALCAPSELAVFRAAVAWLQAEPSRAPRAAVLMAAVRFPLMTFREFREVRAVLLQMEASGRGGLELYSASFRRFGGAGGGQEACRVQRPRETLVLAGGDRLDPDGGQRQPSRQLWFLQALRSHTGLVKDVEWRLLGEMPEPARFRHGLGVLEGRLYVFGGCHFYAKFDNLKCAYRYDPLEGSWLRLADMPENRSNFSLVERKGRFYAIGGDRDINNNMDSVACYCPSTDHWSLAHPLSQAQSGQAASVWDGEIFVSGGFDCRYQCLGSMFLYDPERGSTPLSRMGGDRALHCMESVGRCVYVAGGVCNLRSFYTDQLACEVYDPRRDCWSALPPFPVPHAAAASAVMGGRLYLLGGYRQDDDSDSPLVHRYHPGSRLWESMGAMPGPNTDIRACYRGFIPPAPGPARPRASGLRPPLRLHWRALQSLALLPRVGHFGPQTIWAGLEPVALGTHSLELLFESKSSSFHMGAGGRRQQCLSVLGVKRSNIITITLSRLPPPHLLPSAILSMDCAVLDRDDLQKLQILVPSEEELCLIREAQARSPDLPLAAAELCLTTLGAVPHLRPRLQLWAFALSMTHWRGKLLSLFFTSSRLWNS